MAETASITPFPQTDQSAISQVDYACRVSDNSVLCIGALQHGLTGKETILLDGMAVEKPYLAAILSHQGKRLTAMLLHVEEQHYLDTFGDVTLEYPGGRSHWQLQGRIDEHAEALPGLLQGMTAENAGKLLMMLLKYAAVSPAIAADTHYAKLCDVLRQRMQADEAVVSQSFWLLPHVLYLEAVLPSREYAQARFINITTRGVQVGKAMVMDTPYKSEQNGQIVTPMLVMFSREAVGAIRDGSFSLQLKDRVLPLQQALPRLEPNTANFIAYLRLLPEYTRLNIRDFVCRQLMDNPGKGSKEAITDLLRNMQLFLLPSYVCVYEKDGPFGIHVDMAVAVPGKGIVVAGWMYDPMRLMQRLTLVSDLGRSTPVQEVMVRFRWDEVAELYEENHFSSADDDFGFMAYLPYDDETLAAMEQWPDAVSFRLTAELQGGLSYTVAPKHQVPDPFVARTHLLERIASRIAAEDDAAEAMGSAATMLQQACVGKADIRRSYQYGKAVSKPKVSVIIPLYKEYGFISTQVAHFAHDEFMGEAEIIYVLDAPEDQEQIRAQLGELSRLYGLPISLLVMSHNAGYATATNLGARHANAPHLLLMNSDVVPMEAGWLESMLGQYTSGDAEGALAPKLLFEDGGVQHAGMYFAMHRSGEFYENLHYGKGYPAGHAEVNQSREVPAVSGACLLISRSAFNKVDGLTTDYVVGDFEDSDLCLKLRRKGLTSYYYADVSLYHFERQSMDKVEASPEARFWLNASEHHRRWSKDIEEVMKDHG